MMETRFSHHGLWDTHMHSQFSGDSEAPQEEMIATAIEKGLAGICFFSEYYFMRFFKKYMGMSCVQYIKNVRLERAADQFENGETNTLEVALACGFSNLSYFHREFKKKYGMTPKRFISLSARAADFHEGVNNYHFYDS